MHVPELKNPSQSGPRGWSIFAEHDLFQAGMILSGVEVDMKSSLGRTFLAWAALVFVVSMAGMVVFPTAIGPEAPSPDVPEGGCVRIYLHMRPPDLNPHTRGYAAESLVTDYLFDHLLDRDPDDPTVYRPALALSHEESPDRRHYTFLLRKGVVWHDGTPFTAHDVKFTFDFCRRANGNASMKDVLEEGVTCKVLGPHQVRIDLKNPSWRLFDLIAESSFTILPRHLLQGADAERLAAFGRAPTGTGPYKLQRWKVNSNSIHLVRNQDYWGFRPAVSGIIFKTYTDPVAAFADFKNVNLDVFPRLRPDTFFKMLAPGGWTPERVRSGLQAGHGVVLLPEDAHPGFRFGGYSTTRVSFLVWNCRRFPTKDRAVRRALAHLLNREALTRGGGHGLGHPVTGDQVWFGPAYDSGVKPLPFDPGRARALLEKEGWFDRDGDGVLDRGGKRLSLAISYPARASAAVLHQLAADARKAGVEIKVKGLEHGRYSRLKDARDFDGLYLAWVLDVEEDPYPVWHSRFSRKGANYSGFDKADALIEEIRKTTDARARWNRLKRLQAVIHGEQPVLFIQASTLLVAWHPRIRGVRFHPLKPPGWDLREWHIPKSLRLGHELER